MSGKRSTNNTADCPVLWGHGNRNFTDYRLQQDFNNYSQHNVSNNNQYRLMLQRNGQAIIDQHRGLAYKANQCKSCDTCGKCIIKKEEK